MSHRPLLVVVGGFLGAGKTTLISRASRVLNARGMKTAIITNDQAPDLVDTATARHAADWTGEVAGGCFCCLFDAFADVAEELAAHKPDVIFAEPVGSCTDLVATVLKPVRDLFPGSYRTAPFTVLVDPQSLAKVSTEESDLSYLFRKQMEEADIICFNKTDRGNMAFNVKGETPVRFMSAKTGEGVEAWLDEIQGGSFSEMSPALELDYARYARAEAVLGWLNARVEFHLTEAGPPIAIVGGLMSEVDRILQKEQAGIAHLKVLDETPSGFLKAAICRTGDEPEIEGDRLSPAATRHSVTLNLRAQGHPDVLKRAVTDALNLLPYAGTITTMSAFIPAEPKPQHRYG